MPETIHVTCASCGTENRVPLVRVGGNERPVCGRCRAPLTLPSGTPQDLTDAGFDTLVRSASVPVLVDCWAPWCGPCRAVAPVLERIAARRAGRLIVAKLNVDENPRTAAQYGVSSIPTLLLFRQGTLVDRAVGAQPESALAAWLDGHGVR
ncbi:MAG: thioredoxin [Candidatus Eisenbacteria bacterium]|nr:thioredoxin [Candidatus Eisenbacteria bacterium]